MAGETEFTSTEPPPRHSAPDCDIYPPSPANPMLLPPTRFDPSSLSLTLPPSPVLLSLPLPLSLSPGWGGLTPHNDPYPSHFTSTNPPSLPPRPLRRFPSTRTQPLFSPFATIALLPPFRNALSDSARWRGDWVRGRLVGDSRQHFFHEEACIWYRCEGAASLRRFLQGGGLAFVERADSG